MGPDTVIVSSVTTVVTGRGELLLVLGSGMLLDAEDESVGLPSSIDWAVIVAVADLPLATVPSEKVTTPPDCVNVPWLVVAETNMRLVPSVLVRTVTAASVGPLFVTVTVYVTVFPSILVVGPELATARSALWVLFTIEPVTLAVLFDEFGSVVLLLTEAVSEKSAPFERFAGALTTSVKVSLLPEATVAVDSVTVPADCEKV